VLSFHLFKTNVFVSEVDVEMVLFKLSSVLFGNINYGTGNSELLELRLLETGFLSRFQLNP
jgi:hypothetical protein